MLATTLTQSPTPALRLMPAISAREQIALLRLVRSMAYDDALTFGAYRLEYLYLAAGFIHYRLYWRGRVIYRHDVRSRRVLDAVQQAVAGELCAQGWRADRVTLVEFGALTPVTARRLCVVRRRACVVRTQWWRGASVQRQPVQLVLL